MEKWKIKIWILVMVSLAAGYPQAFLFAQTPSSTNYRLEDSEFDFGGGSSTSANYTSRDAATAQQTGQSTSSVYSWFSGFFPNAYPGTPGTPTLTNTGGNLYSSLDFVIATGGNSSDTNYAIAISPDNFTTTYYVQADDTAGATTTWQSYLNWGGSSGQRLIGLLSNTTYTIKVKARYGQNSETGFSATAQATTVSPTFSVAIAGLASGTAIGSITTNSATTATSVPFSSLQPGAIKLAAQQITVTTNALAGYTTAILQDNDLSTTNGVTIPPVAASNSAPAAWPGGITTARFGYHTTDASLCTGTTNRFSADDTYAALTASPSEVSCNTGPVSNEVTNIVFKVEIEALQPAGDYKNKVTYITTPQY